MVYSQRLPGFSNGERADVLALSPAKASQATNPMLDKAALFWMEDAAKFMLMLLDRVQNPSVAMIETWRKRGERQGMSAQELERRIAVATGRADRSTVFPGNGRKR